MSLIGHVVGNFRVIAQIGEGGMGTVYLAEHPVLKRRVAVKVLRPDLASDAVMVSRFFNEARAVSEIGHPNIVEVLDLGRARDDGGGAELVYFTMELLEGETLGARIRRGQGALDAVHVVAQCCLGLAASHRAGIVHRDIKPDNIFLARRSDDQSAVKLLDFGIAKLVSQGAAAVGHHTRAGSILGTPAYMSPEQAVGQDDLDARADVYALGAVLYQMLAGRLPFPSDDVAEVVRGHLCVVPPLPSTLRARVPQALEAVAMRALEKRREDRFQSMDDFHAALERAQAKLPSLPTMTPLGAELGAQLDGDPRPTLSAAPSFSPPPSLISLSSSRAPSPGSPLLYPTLPPELLTIEPDPAVPNLNPMSTLSSMLHDLPTLALPSAISAAAAHRSATPAAASPAAAISELPLDVAAVPLDGAAPVVTPVAIPARRSPSEIMALEARRGPSAARPSPPAADQRFDDPRSDGQRRSSVEPRELEMAGDHPSLALDPSPANRPAGSLANRADAHSQPFDASPARSRSDGGRRWLHVAGALFMVATTAYAWSVINAHGGLSATLGNLSSPGNPGEKTTSGNATLHVDSMPHGARVYLGEDGPLVGKTPTDVSAPRSEAGVRLDFRLDGYHPTWRKVSTMRDGDVMVLMPRR